MGVCVISVTGTPVTLALMGAGENVPASARNPVLATPLSTDHADVFQRPVHPPADGAVLGVHGPHLQRLLLKVRQPFRLGVERVRHVQLQSLPGGAPEDGALEVSVPLPMF